MKRINYRKYSVMLYWLIFLAMLCLYFTNDYGLVDIHKTSIVVAASIDYENEEVKVTAQLAVPQPSQSGESVKYTAVQGSGLTVADALNEINSKTGFFPKLLFCRLFLIGESCQQLNLFKTMGCLYRKYFSELTALVAMCKGNGYDMLQMNAMYSQETSEAIQQVLADEAKRSANVSSVNLKDLAIDNYSKSQTCYMPYIEAIKSGTSAPGGGGDSSGGEPAKTPDSGQSGGSSGGGEDGQGGTSSGNSGGGQSDEVEFTARKTAIFKDGMFSGILDEDQSFALDILKNEIRVAMLPCETESKHCTMALKDVSGDVSLTVDKGIPKLNIKFNAKARIQGAGEKVDPAKTVKDDIVSQEVLKATEKAVKERIEQLIEVCKESGCDLLGAKDKLHKFNYKYYDAFKDNLLDRMKVEYNIKIESAN
ncbi:MAG: hypothetical protein J1G07_04280 [Clostridiales bacterium]|nr:hypothetical protein [Clostridiales bacterium]